MGVLGSSVDGLTLDSITELVSRGSNGLGLSIGGGGPVSWSRDGNWNWGRDSDGLLTDNGDWGRGKDGSRDSNGTRSNDDWATDEGKGGKRSEGSGSDTDEGSGSKADDGSWSSNEDWGMSVFMSTSAIGDDSGHQAGENDECLKIKTKLELQT